MKTAELFNTPIRRIWGADGSEWKFWDRDLPIFSELEELVPGKQYDLLSDTPYILAGHVLAEGWNEIEFAGISFTPGRILTDHWWEYAQSQLAKFSLWRLLPKLGVREVKIVAELPPPATSLGHATIWPSTGGILVLDTLMWPPSLFPAILFHEAVHLWQVNTGLFDGFKKNELMAYMGSQVYHWLDDGEEVFNSVSYPYARELGKLTWD